MSKHCCISALFFAAFTSLAAAGEKVDCSTLENKVYGAMDVVQPWTVGRYRTNAEADQWRKDQIEPDLAQLRENRQLYIIPGTQEHEDERNQKTTCTRIVYETDHAYQFAIGIAAICPGD